MVPLGLKWEPGEATFKAGAAPATVSGVLIAVMPLGNREGGEQRNSVSQETCHQWSSTRIHRAGSLGGSGFSRTEPVCEGIRRPRGSMFTILKPIFRRSCGTTVGLLQHREGPLFQRYSLTRDNEAPAVPALVKIA